MTVNPLPDPLGQRETGLLLEPAVRVFTNKTSGRVEAVVKVASSTPHEIVASYEIPMATVLLDGTRLSQLERASGPGGAEVDIPLGTDGSVKITVRFWGYDPHIDILRDGKAIGRV